MTDTEKREWPAPEASSEGGTMATPSDNCPICEQRWGEDPDFVCLGCKRPLAIVPREDTDNLEAVKTKIERRRAATQSMQVRWFCEELLSCIASLDKEASDGPGV